MPHGYRKRLPGLLSRESRRGSSSKHTCTCGKHGGMCKADGCGSRSSKAYANSSSKVGRGHRQFLPGLVEDRGGPWWMEPCGCDYCWDNFEAFAPPAHRNPFDPWEDAPEDCEGLYEPTLAGITPAETDGTADASSQPSTTARSTESEMEEWLLVSKPDMDSVTCVVCE